MLTCILFHAFLCPYRTARQTVGWFWHQMSSRGLNTSTEGACWKGRWNWRLCTPFIIIKMTMAHFIYNWSAFIPWSCIKHCVNSVVHQRAAAQNASSVLRPWAAMAAATHCAQPSSANSQAKPSTTTSMASCRRRASATSSPRRSRLYMREPAWQPPTCNSTDWPIVTRPRTLTTNWIEV